VQFRVTLDHPRADALVKFVKVPRKEVVGVLHENEASLSRQTGNDLLDLFPGAVFIQRALDDQLGFVTALEISKF